MSLTSRISNLFSSNQGPVLAPADGHNHPDIDRSLGVSVGHGAIREKRVEPEHKHVLGEEEEEGRPPYLHVRRLLCTQSPVYYDLADGFMCSRCWLVELEAQPEIS